MPAENTLFVPEPALNTDLPDIIELVEDLNLDLEDMHFAQFKVVKLKGEVLAAGRIRKHDNGIMELCSLGVVLEHRSKGIGTAIVNKLLAEHQGETVYLVTEIPGFFEKSGFMPSTGFPPVLEDKIRRCTEQYACKQALVMVLGNRAV